MPVQFRLTDDDPDRPFTVERYLALASLVAAGEEVTVALDGLPPYGMWWDTIRPSVHVVHAGEGADLPEGIFAGGAWRPTTAEDVAMARAGVAWLADDHAAGAGRTTMHDGER